MPTLPLPTFPFVLALGLLLCLVLQGFALLSPKESTLRSVFTVLSGGLFGYLVFRMAGNLAA